MVSKAATEEPHIRIATIAEAMLKQFGGNAILISRDQVQLATGVAAERWASIIKYLEDHVTD
jgi:hypothetical protein